LTLDKAGNIYGTTSGGGLYLSACLFVTNGCGVVFKLEPSDRSWIESVLYRFTGGADGDCPLSGITFDQSGNIYGTASEGTQYSYGNVFQLTPSATGWSETTLHSFSGFVDGGYPVGGLIPDDSGNLYGTTSGSTVQNEGGTAYELVASNGGWTFSTIYPFSGFNDPSSSLALWHGDLYATTPDGGNGGGSVFKLVPASTGWTGVNLHSFQNVNGGLSPWGSVWVDADGSVFGTTALGGAYYGGVIFEIKP
jgi:hypothetical protein